MQQRPKSLLGQVFAFVAGVTILAVSFVFGAFLLTAFFGLVLIVAVVVLLRGWWLKRQIKNAVYTEDGAHSGESSENAVIDADYTLVDKHRK